MEKVQERTAGNITSLGEIEFRAVFEGALDAMVIADDDGFYLDVNSAACELFGMSRAEMLGKCAADFAIPDYDTPVHWQAFLENQGERGFFPLRRRDGQIRLTEYAATSNFLPGRHLSILRDVTAQHQEQERSSVFARLAYRLSAATSARQAAELIAETADTLLSYDAFSLNLYDADKDELEAVLAIDVVNGVRTNVPPAYHGKPSERARKTMTDGAQLVLRSKAEFEPSGIPFGDTARPSLSLMYVPIRHANQTLGLLSLQSYTPQAYTRQDVETLQGMADQCGGAIFRLRQQRAMDELIARYDHLFESANDAIFVETPAGTIVDVNERACAMYGYTRQELIGKNISFVVADPRFEPGQILAQQAKLFGDAPFEVVDRKRDGTLFPVQVTLTRSRDQYSPLVVAIVRDISAMKRAQGQLAALNDAALQINRAGNLPQMMDLLAMQAREIIGAHMAVTSLTLNGEWAQVVMGVSLSEKYAAYRAYDAKPNGKGIYARVCRENRPMRLTQRELEAHPEFLNFGGDTAHPFLRGWLAVPLIARDGQNMGLIQLSDKYEGDFDAEDEALLVQLAQLGASALENLRLVQQAQKAQARFEQMASSIDQAFWLRDIETGTMLYASPAFEKLWGRARTPRDVFQDDYMNAFVPEDRAIADAALERMKTGQSFEIQARLRRPDDSVRWVQVRGAPVYDEQGNAVRMAGTAEDITERHHAEEELVRRANEFQLLYESTRELTQQRSLSSVLQTIVERTRQLFETAATRLWLYDAARKDVEMVAASDNQVPLGVRVALGVGVVGRAAETRQAFMRNDYHTWEHRARDLVYTPQCILAVPLLFRGELIGAISTDDSRAGFSYSEDDARLMELFAVHAASAVQNARLLDETRARAEQLELLYEAGLAVNHELNPQEQLRLLLQAAMRALRAERACFLPYDPFSQELHFSLVLGAAPDVQERIRADRFMLGQERGIVGWVAQTHQTVNVGDLRSDPRWVVTEPDLESGIWAPVVFRDQLRGVLSLTSTRRNAFDAAHEQLLILYANQFAVAMENARLFDETRARVQQLQALHTIDAALTTSFDLQLILEIHLDAVLRELHVDAADILLFDATLQHLTFAAARGFRSPRRPTQPFWLDDLQAGSVVRERRLMQIPSLENAPAARFALSDLTHEFIAYMGVPLVTKGQVRGVLEIFSRAPFRADGGWLDFLDTLAGQAALAIDNITLHNDLQRKNHELALAYDATIEGWSRALDLRDKETEGHTQRVTEMTLRLAPKMGIPENELVFIKWGALLHDIGKMAIPDAILHKQGPLSPDEWQVMKQHPQHARDLLAPITYLRPAIEIPFCHHERWDGSGYPSGLQGEAIPLAARVFAVVDVWDALLSSRPYRDAWEPQRVLDYLRDKSGVEFDPHVVQTFLEMLDRQK